MDLLRLTLRGLILAALIASGCERSAPQDLLSLGRAYVNSPEARRAALEKSIVNSENRYSKRRLQNYTETGWGALPRWNPRVRPVLTRDIGGPVPRPDSQWRTVMPDDLPWTEKGISSLGEDAFHNFPMQVAPFLRAALDHPDNPERYGLWRSGDRVGGLVWVSLPGGVEPALTCSSCHARTDEAGRVSPGLANGAFDFGRMVDDFHGMVSETRRWGPGRVDVSPDDLENPTAIPDLRAIRFQTHLNRAATLRNSPIGLSVRVETGMVVASGGVVRPPRELAFGIALYLWGLGDRLPELGGGRGRQVFDRECASCHIPPSLAGPPILISKVGTNPIIGESPIRRTGYYQTTSLRGMGDRALMLADGSVRDLPAIVDPARRAPGHEYGFDLDPVERAALVSLLEDL